MMSGMQGLARARQGDSVLIMQSGQDYWTEVAVLLRLGSAEFLVATPESRIERHRLSIPPLADFRLLGTLRDLPPDVAEVDCSLSTRPRGRASSTSRTSRGWLRRQVGSVA